MKAEKLYYIGERSSPQLPKPYFVYGQLTREALNKENCVYGSMCLTGYDTKEEYISAKEKLYNDGFRVVE